MIPPARLLVYRRDTSVITTRGTPSAPGHDRGLAVLENAPGWAIIAAQPEMESVRWWRIEQHDWFLKDMTENSVVLYEANGQ